MHSFWVPEYKLYFRVGLRVGKYYTGFSPSNARQCFQDHTDVVKKAAC